MDIKKRIVALDIGTKRIGIAVSDAMWLGATPIKTINRDTSSIEKIKDVCKEYNTNIILIGVPYNMDGTTGFQANDCIKFIEPLKNEFEILYQDERLSSNEAEEKLRACGKKYTKNKAFVDVTAACVILQSYLDENR